MAATDQPGELDEGLIPVFRINQNFAVVFDSDRESESSPLKDDVQRFVNELGSEACWVTEGRETENYLKQEVVQRCMTDGFPAAAGVTHGKYDRVNKAINALLPKRKECKKVDCAHLCAPKLTDADLAVFDLRKRVTDLVARILVWNRMSVPSPDA